MLNRVLATALALIVAASSNASAQTLAAGQFPAGVTPISYDITLRPDAAAMRFSGSEKVIVRVSTPTDRIVLNAAELQVNSATFDGQAVAFALNAKTEQLTLTLPRPTTRGTHAVTLAWTGTINESPLGLFAIDYKNTDGSAARMLATQFEAADARRFAPLWDAPSFKATFTLTAEAPAGQTAFSNMPAVSVVDIGRGMKRYRFAESPKMSSYLLFFGMGDVERRTVMAGKTEIGVITRRGVGDQGQYALDAATRLLAYYNDYFGQPYPLPKLDMIAGPGSSQTFGAMENWGAIFYFEPELLFDPARATESNRQRIYTVIAHEMAHQWFGDLVTMAWWDDLWLNEGFATWMEGKATADLNPAWNGAASGVSGDRESALTQDATAATHPIIVRIETVDQIGQAFDRITYQKGKAVIGMLESTLGPDVFRDGIRRYMAAYKYSNTVTEQLWDMLAQAAGRPVATIAHDFTLQAGVPLISLTGKTCTNGTTNALLTQTRYGVDTASKATLTWHVPMTLGIVGGATTSAIVSGATPNAVAVQGCGTLLLNQGKRSYQRSRYDAASHAAIVRDFARLPLPDQLGTLGDDFALAVSGDQSFDAYLAAMAQVPVDADPLAWSMISNQLGRVVTLFDDTPLEAPLRARGSTLLAPVMARVGYAAVVGESPLVTNLRETLIGRLGANGDAEVAAQARRYVAALATDGNAIPPAIRTPILRTYAINATSAEWEALLAIARAEKNPVARNGYIRLLGSARDITLGMRALDLLKTDEFTTPQRAGLLGSIAAAHPDMAFDFALAHLDLVNGLTETAARATFIVRLGGGSSNPAMPGKIKAYADTYVAAENRAGANQVLAGIAARAETAARLRPAVSAWAGVK